MSSPGMLDHDDKGFTPLPFGQQATNQPDHQHPQQHDHRAPRHCLGQRNGQLRRAGPRSTGEMSYHSVARWSRRGYLATCHAIQLAAVPTVERVQLLGLRNGQDGRERLPRDLNCLQNSNLKRHQGMIVRWSQISPCAVLSYWYTRIVWADSRRQSTPPGDLL